VHEQAVMRDVIRRILDLAAMEGASTVTRVNVRLGALSHFTPDHFREHFENAVRGTAAEGAAVDAALSDDTTTEGAEGVVLESVELEVPD
jgi:hydrogenase nickel incorporation protein HypA/HybF